MKSTRRAGPRKSRSGPKACSRYWVRWTVEVLIRSREPGMRASSGFGDAPIVSLARAPAPSRMRRLDRLHLRGGWSRWWWCRWWWRRLARQKTRHREDRRLEVGLRPRERLGDRRGPGQDGMRRQQAALVERLEARLHATREGDHRHSGPGRPLGQAGDDLPGGRLRIDASLA